jgi:hypothetical protein
MNFNLQHPRSFPYWPTKSPVKSYNATRGPTVQHFPYLLTLILFVTSSTLLKLIAVGIMAQEFPKHEIKAAARGSIHKSDSVSSIWSSRGRCHRALSRTACLNCAFIICIFPVVHQWRAVCKLDCSKLNLLAKSHVDWLIDYIWVRGLTVPMQLGLIETGPLCTISNHRSPMARKLTLLITSGSRKKDPRYVCLSEAKTSHSQRMWAKVSSFTPHPYTMDCLATPVGESVFSGCYVQ